jgi:hypothetical protein
MLLKLLVWLTIVKMLALIVTMIRTLTDSLHMPPAARGHDACFCTAGPIIWSWK